MECNVSKELAEIELQEEKQVAVFITHKPLWRLVVPIIAREWFCKI